MPPIPKPSARTPLCLGRSLHDLQKKSTVVSKIRSPNPSRPPLSSSRTERTNARSFSPGALLLAEVMAGRHSLGSRIEPKAKNTHQQLLKLYTVDAHVFLHVYMWMVYNLRYRERERERGNERERERDNVMQLHNSHLWPRTHEFANRTSMNIC